MELGEFALGFAQALRHHRGAVAAQFGELCTEPDDGLCPRFDERLQFHDPGAQRALRRWNNRV
jgi:hypothetical protein